MEDMKTYECAICGKTYNTLEERIKCETACLAEQKKLEAELKKSEAEAARKDKATDIYKQLDKVETMLKDYFKEYGYLSLNKNYPYLKFLVGHPSWWF